jgi:ketosteroid isomerase-like protein
MTNRRLIDEPTAIVERFFRSYRDQDRAAAEAIAAEEFVFTSPQDDHIDRASYFEKCFPTASRMKSQVMVYVVAASDEDVFVMYEYELVAGGRHRNAELITVRNGQVVEVQVFFGGAVD